MTERLMAPVCVPKQTMFVVMKLVKSGLGCVTLTTSVSMHPLLSVVNSVSLPADTLKISSVIAPELQRNEYGAVAPVILALMDPLLPPGHVGCMNVAVAIKILGSVS